jgi:hypothetical protein
MNEILTWFSGFATTDELLILFSGFVAGLWIGSMIQEYFDNKKGGAK